MDTGRLEIKCFEKLYRERIVTLILCFSSDLETLQINPIMHVSLSRTYCRQVTSLFSLAIIVLSHSESNPDCLSNIKPDGVIGQNVFNIPRDEVELTCNVTYYGNIPPQMEWKKVGDKNNCIRDGAMSHVISHNRVIHTLQLIGDLDLDNSSYICQTTRSTQNLYNCTSEIIKVLYFVGGKMIEQQVFKGDEITCAAKRNTFSCINQWHYDNYTFDETITTQLLGEYLCKVKCRIRGTAYTYDVMKAFVAELKTSDRPTVPDPGKSASPMASGTIAGIAIVAVIIIIIAIPAALIAVLAVRYKKRKGDKQRRNDDLDEIALLGFPDSDIANDNRVISRNHQFLVENIKPGRLTHLLRKENCITDEEWNQFTNQPTDEFINDALLQWMRTIAFDGVKGQMVLECIRQDTQDFVADLVERGGVVIKSIISTKLVNRFTKSYVKNVEKLKEKEAIVIERLNQMQGLPLSEDRDATLQIPLDDIVIAPCCHQETNEIVLWFLCKSADGQKELHRMYNCGSLLEKLIKVFKQFSNDNTPVSSTLLVPTNITIVWGDFQDIIVEEEIEVLGKIKDATGNAKYIVGVTILNEALFIAHRESSQLNVYNCNDFRNVRLLEVEGLVVPLDMCSCMKNNSLYILDTKSDGKGKKIMRVGTDGKVVGRWFTHDNENGNLSATPEGNVIMTVWDKQMLLEYSPTGQLERKINLPHCKNPFHAIKWNDRYIVSDGGLHSGSNRICLVDKEGKVEKSLMRQKVNQFHRSCYLAAHGSSGMVIVVDHYKNRVLLFDSKLELKAKIVLKNKQRFKHPRNISLSEKLLAVQIDGNDLGLLTGKDCRIFLFNTQPLLEKYNG